MTRQLAGLASAILLSLNAQAQTSTPPAAPPQPTPQVAPALTSAPLTPAQLQDIATLLTGKEPATGLPAAIRDNLKWKIYT